MKIVQVISSLSDESSGPTYYFNQLCIALALRNENLQMHFLGNVPDCLKKCGLQYFSYPRHSFPHPSLGRSPEMKRNLKQVCCDADIVHINSLWMLPNIYPFKAIQNTKSKLVLSPHGTLAGWALNHHRWRKRIIGLFLGQYKVLKKTDIFHATCIKEYKEIRAAGYFQPVAVIPIGINIPRINHEFGSRRKLLFLGRIHPVKAVDRLLTAWTIITDEFPEWDLEIVGPESSYKEKLKRTVSSQKIPRVFFQSEKNGKEKFKCYSSSDLYILPSHTENFGVTVAEALASATPVIVSKNTPWEGVISHRCGWYIDNDVNSIVNQLRESLKANREDLELMGARGKKWMSDDFSWKRIGLMMCSAYNWLLNGGDKPEYILT